MGKYKKYVISMNLLKKPFYILSLAIILVFILNFLLYMLFEYEKRIENDIFRIATTDVLQITQKKASFIKEVLEDSDNYIEDIKEDEILRYGLENYIRSLLTTNIKYTYILYKDKKDTFRFLVDASSEKEKSILNQKFDVTNKKWFELYESKEPIVIKHDAIEKLSISYLVPILNKQKVELVLVVDFSVNKIDEIHKIITLMKSGLMLVLSVIGISLIALIFQTIKYRIIKKSSFMDKLTNIYNRNYLYEIEESIEREKYILAVLDIDFFKKINDTYGHNVGDIVLTELGTILSTSLRENEDIAIRYGGEEFFLLIGRKEENYDGAISTINRIFERIKNTKIYISDNDYISITVSIGVNLVPSQSKNLKEAFKIADLALYEAKNDGRDTIKIYE